ncbi:uncharacterized protein LOC123260425 [Cotesia glomerata]|uniref:uncharacterized protein LOC123260425 n=1 Tax=Cotesia glomerata TaxID=32391 RepID=UPI001D00C467|nr:uncharacterized protein LOC123260425 [Cotesia glomerata]
MKKSLIIFVCRLMNLMLMKSNIKCGQSTDRCSIVNVTSDFEDFIETLVTQLDKLLKHDFIAKTQSRFFSDTKLNLKSGEFAVVFDFAENYAFVVQEAAQGFHWNNDQATIFPMVIYYNENDTIKHLSFVGISDCLKHDTVLIYLFQEQLIAFLKKKFAVINTIFYFSDGAPQQFKNNKAFTNLCYHYADFEINAEWHFFATAHGKGPCDGLAGSLKRYAARASLQMNNKEHILKPQDLFSWGTKNFTSVDFTFIANDDYLIKKMC